MSLPEKTECGEPIRYAEVPGFPGYLVSSDGFVWSAWTWAGGGRRGESRHKIADQWRKLVGGKCKHGYFKVILCNNGKRKCARVNNLVLTCFVGPAPKGMVSAHGNGICTDNRLDNLRWATQKENLQDRHRHGTYQIGDTSTNRKLYERQVKEILSRLARGEAVKSLAAEFGVKTVTVYAIKAGRNWKHVKADVGDALVNSVSPDGSSQ